MPGSLSDLKVIGCKMLRFFKFDRLLFTREFLLRHATVLRPFRDALSCPPHRVKPPSGGKTRGRPADCAVQKRVPYRLPGEWSSFPAPSPV